MEDRRDERTEHGRLRADDPSLGVEGRSPSDPTLADEHGVDPEDAPGVEIGDLGKVSDETERTPGEGRR